ncbi:hypothetical protein [Paenibacillus antarcticus]|uniref:hypothetical protein n=1 Tax=Paenibacillus antarcticus TaxID=253703 RepID=UPI000A3FF0FD|nr:hypothetical protein [Paenibacillus antarcticus]
MNIESNSKESQTSYNKAFLLRRLRSLVAKSYIEDAYSGDTFNRLSLTTRTYGP